MNLLVNVAMPDFLIIGTMKGGTTSLYHYLLTHPQIAAATRKEVHFFDKNFHRGIAWYRTQFPSLIQCDMAETRQGQRVITGEATPNYLFHPHAPARAALVVPKAKLIVLHDGQQRAAFCPAHSSFFRRVSATRSLLSPFGANTRFVVCARVRARDLCRQRSSLD
jgi:hypothetical protein